MQQGIEVGACYRDREVFWIEWRVERFIADYHGTPHVVVRNLSDPTVRRTIACEIMSDRRRYHRISDEEAGPRGPVLVAHRPKTYGWSAPGSEGFDATA